MTEWKSKVLRLQNVKVSMDVAPQREGWKSYKFNIHDFAAIDETRGDCFCTPEFSCNGHQWELDIYPGGCRQTKLDGCTSIFLAKRSKGGVSATFEVKIFNKFGGVDWNTNQLTNFYHPNGKQAYGWPNFCLRSHLLDLSKNVLDDDGTLAIVISIKEDPSTSKPFIPKNPCQNMLQKKFLDEETSDVCFEIGRGKS
ncbi:LOW QUALITY PROTEIN: hypothetical protein ACHAWC_000497 [Mediolabrus comicus]